MGHPPFGHRVEETLDELVREYRDGLPDAEDHTPEADDGVVTEDGDGAVEADTAPADRADMAAVTATDESDPHFGFEGNAQSLRIVTKLSQSGLESVNLTPLERSEEFELDFQENDVEGLHLTRAALNALIKYPWSPDHRSDKYGYYPRTERACFEFARQLGPADREQTLEAQLMDYADDVTYAIHDMTDFYQDGRLPLHVLLNEGYEIRSRIDDANPDLDFDCYDPDPETRDDRLPNTPELDRFTEYISALPPEKQELDEALLPAPGDIARTFAKLAQAWPDAIGQHSLTVFRGSPDERRVLDRFTSDLINRYLGASEQYQPTVAVKPRDGSKGYRLEKEDEIKREVWVLRKLTEFYVLRDSALMGQQRGEEEVIRELYHALYSEIAHNDGDLGFSAVSEPFSTWLNGWQRPETMDTDELYWARIVADIIATLTEQQALQLYRRLTGQSPGSLQDRIIK
jgi:dGTPase